MTKDRLNRFLDMRREQEELEERVARMRCRLVGGVSPLTGLPGGGGERQEAEAAYLDLVGRMEARAADLTAELMAVWAWIEGVEDSYLRRALCFRYMDGLSWVGVAGRLRGTTADAVRMMVCRGLAKRSDFCASPPDLTLSGK